MARTPIRMTGLWNRERQCDGRASQNAGAMVSEKNHVLSLFLMNSLIVVASPGTGVLKSWRQERETEIRAQPGDRG